MRLNVKWGKQLFKDVEVDMEQSPLVFKTQLFTLSGVSPERQKIMVKAKLLGDDAWDSVAQLKDGQTVLLMGSASEHTVAPPTEPVTFMEDMPEEERDHYGLKMYGAGLKNMGNTCYMNATLQLFYAVPELRESLVAFDASRGPGISGMSAQLAAAAGGLFKDMTRAGDSVMPVRFLLTLRNSFPQFAERVRDGIYRQQDAEECYTQVAQCLSETIKVKPEDPASASLLQELFGIEMVTTIKCKETEESITSRTCETKLKCNIPPTPPIHHVHEGIIQGLIADRSQMSESVGRNVLFEGSSQLERLPPYLILHMVRFSYRQDTNQRAKILRKVAFPAVMDLYEFCTPEYKHKLDVPRKRYEELRDAEIEQNKALPDQNEPTEAAAATIPSQVGASSSTETPAPPPDAALTGRYKLLGVLTHKGRSADSGHYVTWVKHEDGQWIQYDDEDLIPAKEDDVMQLSGGGDWHMAYLLLFKAETVKMAPQ